MALVNWNSSDFEIKDTRIADMDYYKFVGRYGEDITHLCHEIREKQQKLDNYKDCGGSLTISAESEQLAVIDEDAPFFKDYLLAHLESEIDELKVELKKLLAEDVSEENYTPEEIKVDKMSDVKYPFSITYDDVPF